MSTHSIDDNALAVAYEWTATEPTVTDTPLAEALTAQVALREDPDAVKSCMGRVELWRDDAQLATFMVPGVSTGDIHAIVRLSVSLGFNRVIVSSDMFVATAEVDPVTGKPWDAETMSSREDWRFLLLARAAIPMAMATESWADGRVSRLVRTFATDDANGAPEWLHYSPLDEWTLPILPADAEEQAHRTYHHHASVTGGIALGAMVAAARDEELFTESTKSLNGTESLTDALTEADRAALLMLACAVVNADLFVLDPTIAEQATKGLLQSRYNSEAHFISSVQKLQVTFGLRAPESPMVSMIEQIVRQAFADEGKDKPTD